MAKQLEYSQDARSQLMQGFDVLAKAVGITLGPKGRNVILDDDFGPPQVCSDGVTIAKEIELKQPFQNMGAQLLKEAASKTNDAVGDGTTTSTILAQSIVREGFKNITAGANPMALKRGIEKAVAVMKAELEAMAQPVEGKEQIKQVAVLAAHDEEMGGILADVIDEVGSEGVITIEESKGVGYEVEYVEGMQVDRGFSSPYFVTDATKMTVELDNPYVLVTTEKISSMADLLPLLEKLTAISRTLVIVSEDVEGEALATLVVNKLRGTLNCLAVKAPGFGDRRKAILEDMAVLFGANVISADLGRKLDSAEVADLGRCRRVVADKDNTTFVEGAGDEDAISARIGQLKVAGRGYVVQTTTARSWKSARRSWPEASPCSRWARTPRSNCGRSASGSRTRSLPPGQPSKRASSRAAAPPWCARRRRPAPSCKPRATSRPAPPYC